MAVIESVALRQRGAYDFENHYDNLCALQNSCPIPAVKAHLKDGILDINGDRVRSVDWVPILNTIQINKSLTFIAIRSYYQLTIEERENANYPYVSKTKIPAVRSKDITYQICRALRDCLACSPSLKVVELQGLPLRERDLQVLVKGLAKNNTLHHLSLEYTSIGDDGLEIICKGIQNSNSITSLNLTACGLSGRSGELIGKVIKLQAMRRHHEAWKGSLRYRRPDLDSMQGLRRITMNFNPMLGDLAASALAETLKDDLWLKALDMQQCGISNVGAKALLDILKYNTIIVVLDLRKNPLIDAEIQRSIMEHLMINSNGKETDYPWMTADDNQELSSDSKELQQRMVRKKRTKTLQSSFGRKTTIKVAAVSKARGNRTNVNGVRRPVQPVAGEQVRRPGPGIPWRTALRASRYKGYPHNHVPGKASLFENLSSGHNDDTVITMDYSSETGGEESMDTSRVSTDRRLVRSDGETDSRATKVLKIELEQVKRRLHEETAARSSAEERMLELTVENNRLRSELEQSKQRQSLLDNDTFLENVEASFKQFHAFLDLLRDAGLGQLISLAGINQTQLTIPKTNGTSSKSPRKLDSDKPFSKTFKTAPTSSASFDENSFNHHQPSPWVVNGNNTAWAVSGSNTVTHFPQLRPENYLDVRDPTMQSVVPSGGELQTTNTLRQAPFDEMYEKLMHDVKSSGGMPIQTQSKKGPDSVKRGEKAESYGRPESNGLQLKTNALSPSISRDEFSGTYGKKSEREETSERSSKSSGKSSIKKLNGKSSSRKNKETRREVNSSDEDLRSHHAVEVSNNRNGDLSMFPIRSISPLRSDSSLDKVDALRQAKPAISATEIRTDLSRNLDENQSDFEPQESLERLQSVDISSDEHSVADSV